MALIDGFHNARNNSFLRLASLLTAFLAPIFFQQFPAGATPITGAALAQQYALEAARPSMPQDAFGTKGAGAYQPSISAALAEQKITEPVMVGYFNFPPRMFTKNGKPSGVTIALAEGILIEAGLRYQFVEIPVGRIYGNLAASSTKLHAWIGVLTGQYVHEVLAVKPSVFLTSELMLFGLRGKPLPGFDALQNTVVITVTGYRYSGHLAKLQVTNRNITILSTPTHQAAFRMLLAGRGPYVLDYKNPAVAAARNLKLDDLTSKAIYTTRSYLLVSKRGPEPQVLHTLLEAASRRIVARSETKEDRLKRE